MHIPTKEVETDTIVFNSDGTILSGLFFSTNEELKIFRGCTKINGDLVISGFTGEIDFSVFDCLQEITGNFYITNNTFEKISRFEKLETVGGYFAIYSNAELRSISGFNMLKIVVETFESNNNSKLITISGFKNLERVDGDFKITNNVKLEEISEFESLRVIVKHLSIYSNLVLKKISGFVKLERVIANFEIFNNKKIITISGFGALLSVGFFQIVGNELLTTIPDFEKLEIVGTNQFLGYFRLNNNAELTEISGFVALRRVHGYFEIFNNVLLTRISGFVNLETVGGYFSIYQNGGNVTPLNNIVLTVSGFGSFTAVPKGITGALTLEGIATDKLLSISQAIIDNMTNIPNFTLTPAIFGVTVTDVEITL